MSRQAIQDLVHRYADGVVRRDRAQWLSTWADDGVWDLGQRAPSGIAELGEFYDAAMTGFASLVQNVMNGTARVDDTAGTGTGRWYIIEFFEMVGGDKGMLLAYYDDVYVRDCYTWRFARRTLTVQYQGPPDLSADFVPCD